MRKSNTHVRMKDVARLANVSAITVSRALSHPDKVSEDTRKRIAWAVEKIGYVPNRVAGGLASSRTGIIAAVVPTIDNPVYGSTLQGLSDVLREQNYRLLLSNSGPRPQDEEQLLSTLLSYRPEGMFLHSANHTDTSRRLLEGAGIPIVEAGDLPRRPIDMVVSYSSYASAKAMTLYLGQRGYRHIGFVCNDVRINTRARERRRGYFAALRELGLPVDHQLVCQTALGFREGAEALRVLLARCPQMDAIFYSAELWAIGGLLECQRLGWKVPERMAVVGYDNSRLSPEVSPALTAAWVPRAEIGRMAGEMLLRRIRGEPIEKNVVDLGYRIIEGASA